VPAKKIIAPPFVEILRVEIIRSRQRGAYSDGSVIGTQPLPIPEQHPCFPVSVDIADRSAELRHDVDAEPIVTDKWQPARGAHSSKQSGSADASTDIGVPRPAMEAERRQLTVMLAISSARRNCPPVSIPKISER
jgi:hypothetical protein